MDQNHILEQDCSINVLLMTMHTHTEQHNNIYEVHLLVPPMSQLIVWPAKNNQGAILESIWAHVTYKIRSFSGVLYHNLLE